MVDVDNTTELSLHPCRYVLFMRRHETIAKVRKDYVPFGRSIKRLAGLTMTEVEIQLKRYNPRKLMQVHSRQGIPLITLPPC